MNAESRLPPGGFSLHGMLKWFRRLNDTLPDKSEDRHIKWFDPVEKSQSPAAVQIRNSNSAGSCVIADVLLYIKSAFSRDDFLDEIQLDEAVSPGAFYAWRSHRLSTASDTYNRNHKRVCGDESMNSLSRKDTNEESSTKTWPGQWNWDGVWKDRVNKAIQASIADSNLFGHGRDNEVVSKTI